MEHIVWRLRDQGYLLEIMKIDPATRKICQVIPLKLTKPMDEAAATKYISDNYPPNKTSVRLAADTIDAGRRQR